VQVDIWSDVACPWCYIGKRRFERAREQFRAANEGVDVDVRWRAFELDPDAPTETGVPLDEMLATKYGMTIEQAREANARVTELAAAEGLTYALDRARRGNSFDAHRLARIADDQAGLGDAVVERLFRAYFSEGRNIAEHDELVAIAEAAGLDGDAARAALEGGEGADSVREDEALAARLGIRGVPFFVIDGRYAISGAQPKEVFERALDLAWKEHAATSLQTFAEGAACGPDGCAI
jgi:protein disulfide-isomerase